MILSENRLSLFGFMLSAGRGAEAILAAHRLPPSLRRKYALFALRDGGKQSTGHGPRHIRWIARARNAGGGHRARLII
jgi:hypothetical protein